MALDDVIRDLLVEISKYLNQRTSDGRRGGELVQRHYIVRVRNSLFLPGVSTNSTAAASDSSPHR